MNPQQAGKHAMNMTSNVYMNSTTKFMSMGAIDPNLKNIEQLKQKALGGFLSPHQKTKKQQVKNISINQQPKSRLNRTKLSQLGSSALFQGLDSPQNRTLSGNKNSFSKVQAPKHQAQRSAQQKSGNKQHIQRSHGRHIASKNQSSQVSVTIYRGNTKNNGNNNNNNNDTDGKNIVVQEFHKNHTQMKDDFSIKENNKKQTVNQHTDRSQQQNQNQSGYSYKPLGGKVAVHQNITVVEQKKVQIVKPTYGRKPISQIKLQQKKQEPVHNIQPQHKRSQTNILKKELSPLNIEVKVPIQQKKSPQNKSASNQSGYVYRPPKKSSQQSIVVQQLKKQPQPQLTVTKKLDRFQKKANNVSTNESQNKKEQSQLILLKKPSPIKNNRINEEMNLQINTDTKYFKLQIKGGSTERSREKSITDRTKNVVNEVKPIAVSGQANVQASNVSNSANVRQPYQYKNPLVNQSKVQVSVVQQTKTKQIEQGENIPKSTVNQSYKKPLVNRNQSQSQQKPVQIVYPPSRLTQPQKPIASQVPLVQSKQIQKQITPINVSNTNTNSNTNVRQAYQYKRTNLNQSQNQSLNQSLTQSKPVQINNLQTSTKSKSKQKQKIVQVQNPVISQTNTQVKPSGYQYKRPLINEGKVQNTTTKPVQKKQSDYPDKVYNPAEYRTKTPTKYQSKVNNSTINDIKKQASPPKTKNISQQKPKVNVSNVSNITAPQVPIVQKKTTSSYVRPKTKQELLQGVTPLVKTYQTSKIQTNEVKKQISPTKIPEKQSKPVIPSVINSNSNPNNQSGYVYRPPKKSQKFAKDMNLNDMSTTVADQSKSIEVAPIKKIDQPKVSEIQNKNIIQNSNNGASIEVKKPIYKYGQKSNASNIESQSDKKIEQVKVEQVKASEKRQNFRAERPVYGKKQVVSSTIVEEKKPIQKFQSPEISAREKSKSNLLKQTKSEIKQAQIQDKKVPIKRPYQIFLIVKTMYKNNLQKSFKKILTKSKQTKNKQTKLTSILLSQTSTFSKNYQQKLLQQSFTQLKKKVLNQFNKQVQAKKQEEMNNLKFKTKQVLSVILQSLFKSKVKNVFDTLNKNKLWKRSIVNSCQSFHNIITKKEHDAQLRSFKNIKFYSSIVKLNIEDVFSIFKASTGKNLKDMLHKLFSTAYPVKNVKSMNKTDSQKSISLSRVSGTHIQQNKGTLSNSPSQKSLTSRSFKGVSPINNVKEKVQKLQKQISQKTTTHERQMKDLSVRKESCRKQIKKSNTQVQQKKQQNKQLKQQLEKSQEKQSHEVYDEFNNGNYERLEYLSELYTNLYKVQNEEIDIVLFKQSIQTSDTLSENPKIALKQWMQIRKNIELKNNINKYQGVRPRQYKATRNLVQQQAVAQKLLRSYVRQRYLWEWVRKTASSLAY